MIAQQARDAAPHEVCGLIGGIDGQATEVVPVPNVADDPVHHFVMDEQILAKTLLRFHRAGLELVAVYHSHPQSGAIPSSSDIAESHYPEAAYLIVSLKERQPFFKAWQIANATIKHVDVYIGDSAPNIDLYHDLTRAQKIAIMIAGIMAFIVLIVWSIDLLPPAPSIPSP
ncbi:MAG: M67 family peptidase [Chloroflexi bacterium]|nr:MAG: hypothetical protein CUN54_06525 [Phototrophicales bacterium]RMF76982.1 MAG: M67 family peptidase [Chloroflexota bacterium]